MPKEKTSEVTSAVVSAVPASVEVKGLYPKFYALQQKLFGKQVFKSGENTYSHYSYATKEDVIAAVQKEVQSCGLVFIPTYKDFSSEGTILVKTKTKVDPKTKEQVIESVQEKRTRTFLTLVMKVINPDDGEFFEIVFPGDAEDTQDKATWKSYTGIQKYFWVKTFNLQDNDLGSEPENDDPRDTTGATKEDEKARTFKALKMAVTEGRTGLDWDKAEIYFKGTLYADEVAKLKTVSVTPVSK